MLNRLARLFHLSAASLVNEMGVGTRMAGGAVYAPPNTPYFGRNRQGIKNYRGPYQGHGPARGGRGEARADEGFLRGAGVLLMLLPPLLGLCAFATQKRGYSRLMLRTRRRLGYSIWELPVG